MAKLKGTEKVIEGLKVLRECLDNRCFKTKADVVELCSKAVEVEDDFDYCSAYAFPSQKWRLGDCPLADSFLKTAEVQESKGKVRIGQQKQKKKSRRK